MARVKLSGKRGAMGSRSPPRKLMGAGIMGEGESEGAESTPHLDRVGDERRDGLLAIVEVHESTDVPLHVRLVARVLELPAKLHSLIRLEEVLRRNRIKLRQLLLRHPELELELGAQVRPINARSRPHLIVDHIALRSYRAAGEVHRLDVHAHRGGCAVLVVLLMEGCGREGVRTGEESCD